MKDRSGVFRSHCALCDCAEYERKEDSHQCGDCPHGPTEHEAVRGCSKCNCLRFVEEGLSQECFACLHRRDAHSEADEKCRPTQPHGQGGQSRSCTVRQAVEAARQLSSTEDRRVDVIMRATGRPSPTSAISSRRGSLGVGSTSSVGQFYPGNVSEGELCRRTRKRCRPPGSGTPKGKRPATATVHVEKEVFLLPTYETCIPRKGKRLNECVDEGRLNNLAFSTSDSLETLQEMVFDIFYDTGLLELYESSDLEFVRATSSAIFLPEEQPRSGKELLPLARQGRIYVRLTKLPTSAAATSASSLSSKPTATMSTSSAK